MGSNQELIIYMYIRKGKGNMMTILEEINELPNH